MTKVEKVGESTRLCTTTIDDGLVKIDKKVLILEHDRDIRIKSGLSEVHQRKGNSYIRYT